MLFNINISLHIFINKYYMYIIRIMNIYKQWNILVLSYKISALLK